MDIEELVDRYRSSPPKRRYALVLLVSLLPAAYYWLEEGDVLQVQFEQARDEEQAAQARLENTKRRVADLPNLLSRVKQIEEDLEKARRILPDKVEIDQVLASLGKFEKDLDVTLQKFVPGIEVQPNPQIEYREFPVDLTVRGTFPQVMKFYDQILHMPNLTHLRSVQFNAIDAGEDNNGNARANTLTESTSKLILFKGM
ncbi:MAG: type 4a pilus biogenesis protein PilO [Oligoflexus sp.]